MGDEAEEVGEPGFMGTCERAIGAIFPAPSLYGCSCCTIVEGIWGEGEQLEGEETYEDANTTTARMGTVAASARKLPNIERAGQRVKLKQTPLSR